MLIRALSVACGAVAIGCLVGGSVMFFTVQYHSRITTCKSPTVKAKASTLFGNVTLCRTPQ